MSAAATVLPDIRRDIKRVLPDVVSHAVQFATAILADVTGRRGTMNGRDAGVLKPGETL